MLYGMFMQAAQQAQDRAQPNPIQYKVCCSFNTSYENVVCVKTQESEASKGTFLEWMVFEEIRDLPRGEKIRLAMKFSELTEKVASGFYEITNFLPSGLLKNVPLSTIPHSLLVMPCINDLPKMPCDPNKALLITEIGLNDVLTIMNLVERMPRKPKRIFFQTQLLLEFEDVRGKIRRIDAARQTYFYAGLFLDKNRRENEQWRCFPKELRNNILAFIGHPYDMLDKK